MSDYPTLAEMGIRSFAEVSHFKVRQEHKADVLKVYYHRRKGSILPRSKKFTFVRPSSAVPLQYRHDKGWEQFTNASPRLKKAVEELTVLTGGEIISDKDQKSQFLSDLDHLEKVMQAKIAEMRRQVEALD